MLCASVSARFELATCVNVPKIVPMIHRGSTLIIYGAHTRSLAARESGAVEATLQAGQWSPAKGFLAQLDVPL